MIVASAFVGACGKKGPPLPPLVKLPVAPADFTAERRGDRVDLQLTVPAVNTDNTKPANIERVDVYGLTTASAVTDADLFKYGTRVGSIDVKAPRDPDATADPDESASEVEPPTGTGLDQGARAHLDEPIDAATLKPAAAAGAGSPSSARDGDRPLLGPSLAPPSRTYISVGITTRGRKGPASKRVVLPLVPPPVPPPAPTVTYTESAVTVAWTVAEAPPPEDVLPSRPLGEAPPTIGVNVYELGATAGEKTAAAGTAPGSAGAATSTPAETRLTPAPIADRKYSDPRITWGVARCYVVRAAETIEGTTIESAPSPKTCVTLTDTFPPAAPKQLTAVASEGAISLIWDANTEADLAGYLVLRGTSADALEPVTPAPITETTFKDTVQPGIPYVYAVEAVDKAGNASAPSNIVTETAR